ncbi:hypothetical protein GCM10027275_36330 [Rhabdobacter roseus]|uniref:Cell division initiation protein n=1 Tax=Rhabdobacter roseus TaxID=1655419 RepID=A0A840U1F5_9BACT|nr:DivIVA domain-containing protein [Rhabdobacter roseus]MBB5285960.1 cell division initiation protein [Rhabdobacter roseus]
MKISPIDIRQHTFEKVFRGYNVDEVNAFLNSLSQEWERIMNEQKMLKMQLEIAEKELNKLKDVEMTLFRTLKTAEDTSGQITEQANKAAEKYLQESRQKSDELLNEAKRKASMLIQDAENQSKYIKEEILNELKNQDRDFKAMEKYRDNLIVQLRTLVSTTSETVDRFEKKFNKDSFLQKMEEVTQQVAESSPEAGADEAVAASEEVLVGEEQSQEEQPQAEEATEESQPVEEPVAEAPLDEEVPPPAAEPITEPESTPEEKPEEVVAEVEPEPAPDAASEAMAEAQKVKKAVQEANERLEKSNEARAMETSAAPKKGGGSFFDQIN